MKLRILAAALLCVALNHAPAFGQTTILPPGETCMQATTGLNGMIGVLGAIAGGSGGTTGTYGGVALTGGSGTGATANITVAGGAVSAVTILNPGTQFVVGDVLSAAAGTIGGVTGFSVPINSVTINSSLAGGTVGYYVPNTLTFKTTWKNSTQTVPNTNPVRLDQNGCGTVYGLGSYRQIVKDSLGNTVWDALTASTAALGTNPATSGAGDFLPIGAILPISGYTVPTNYVLAFGQAISRTSFPDALTALTISSTASCVSGNSTLSGVASTAQVRVGAAIEGSCIAPGSTVASIIGPTSLGLSIAATATTSATVKVFNWGNGDGSSTFNVPDLRGRVLPGSDAMGGTAASRLISTYYGVSAAPPGAASTLPAAQNGSQTLVVGNLPAYTPTGSVPITDPGHSHLVDDAASKVGTFTGGGSNGWGGNTPVQSGTSTTGVTAGFTGTPQGGSSTPFSIIQPSITVNYAVKISNGTLPTVGVISLGGMSGDIACGANILCSLQIISLKTALDFSATTVSGGTFNNPVLDGPSIGTGTLTNVSNPVAATDVANKQYVDSVSQGLLIQTSVVLATAAVLPNTPTYSNGASGVGATLTAGSNAALVVDGTAATLNWRVLVKNQVSQFQNGCYTITTVGSGSVPWVLTRCTDFDTSAEMLKSSYFLVTSGATLVNSSWVLTATTTTVGTTAVVFTQFSGATVAGVSDIAGVSGSIALSSNLSMVGSTLTSSARSKLAANTSYFVRLDGNDTACTGLTNAAYVSGSFPQNCAWLTLQKSADYISQNIDLGGFTATVQTACASPPCTFSAGVQQLTPFTGTGWVLFQGDTTTPTNQVISVNGSAVFQATYGVQFQVGGFKLVNAAAGGDGIYASGRSLVYIAGKLEFGAIGGSQIEANGTGSQVINVASAWTLSGGGTRHLYVHHGATFENAVAVTVTSTGTPTFTNTVISRAAATLNASNMTYSGPCNGQRYSIFDNSVVDTNGGGASYFCGNAPGGVLTGGIYN